MAIWETRPETKAGPIWRARREENVNSLMGSALAPPRPPRPPAGAAGGSSWAKAESARESRSANFLMRGIVSYVEAGERREGIRRRFTARVARHADRRRRA